MKIWGVYKFYENMGNMQHASLVWGIDAPGYAPVIIIAPGLSLNNSKIF